MTSHEICPYYQGILGRCYANPGAIPTPLCNIGPDGEFDLHDCLLECDPGWYCPRVSSCYPFNNTPPNGPEGINPWSHTPQFCPPDVACSKTRLGSGVCDTAQGMFEPLLCPPGHFCPNTTTMVPCDAGFYCMRGSTAPTPCPPLSFCPPNTEFRRYYGGLLSCLFLDMGLVLLFLFVLYRVEPALQKVRAHTKLGILASLWEVLKRGEIWGGKGSAGASSSASSSSASSGVLGAGNGDYVSLDGAATGATDSVELGEVESTPQSPFSGGGTGGASGAASPTSASTLAAKAAARTLKSSFTRCNGSLSFDIEFDNFCYTVPALKEKGGVKHILKGITGRIAAGRVTAIMGPSGAGKTSFLKVLFGKETRTSGALRINGEAREMGEFKKMVGYVPQEDLVLGELTVRENVLFSARMRLPKSWAEPAIQAHVDAVIDVLRLTPSADVRFASLSGGQKKRTNIAVELAMAPAAIFLDEPTSGLDSTVALELCDELRAIARLGITVVTVIHQPRVDIFNAFDDLLLLCPGKDLGAWTGGNVAYLGPQAHVAPYFTRLGCAFVGNPSDDIMDALMEVGGHWGGMVAQGSELMRVVGEGQGGASSSSTPTTPLGGGDSSSSSSSSSSLDGGRVSLLDASYMTDGGGGNGGRVKSLGELLSEYWASAGQEWVRGVSGSMTTSRMGSIQQLEGFGGKDSSGSSGSSGSGGSSSSSSSGGGAPFDVTSVMAERGAPFHYQLLLCHWRSYIQQYRTVTSFILEVGVAVLAGGMMGLAALAVPSLYVGVFKGPYVAISPSPIENLLPSVGLFVALAIAVAASPAGVKTFGEERLIYFREASSGHNRAAYYIAKTLAVLTRLTIGAFHFVSIFHFLATPTMDFSDFFIIVWCQYFGVYGLAALTSMLVARENSALVGVIAALVVSCLCGYGPNLNQGREWGVSWVQACSFSRWALEAFFHKETLAYRPHYMVTEVSAGIWGYTLDRYEMDIALMLVIGVLLRGVAFLLMVGLNRKEQK